MPQHWPNLFPLLCCLLPPDSTPNHAQISAHLLALDIHRVFPFCLHCIPRILHLLILSQLFTRYYQRVSGLTTSTCKLCGIPVPEGSRLHHLRSKHPEFVTANSSMAGEDSGFVAACTSKSGRAITSVCLTTELVQVLSGLNQPT